MADAVTSDTHKKQLELLEDYLNRDGWETSLQAPDQSNPYHSIAVKILSDEDFSEVWTMELSFLPIPEDNLPEVSILQCFVSLVNNFPTLLKPALYEVISLVNTKLPLGGFGFFDDLTLLYFKHNLMVATESTTAGSMVVSESLGMLVYLVSTYTASITDVAIGAKTAASAITDLRAAGLFS